MIFYICEMWSDVPFIILIVHGTIHILLDFKNSFFGCHITLNSHWAWVQIKYVGVLHEPLFREATLTIKFP